MSKFIISALAAAICSGFALKAEVRLPALVGDNMVLQQNTDVKIWGWAKPGATVSVNASWGGHAKARADADGSWLTTMATPEASLTPYTLTISDGDGSPVKLTNVMSGEVWITSGQSNMEMTVGGGRDCYVEDAQELLTESIGLPYLRLLTVDIEGCWDRKEDVRGSWQISTPAVVEKFSAIGFKFGADLQKTLNIPVGIINASCGGTWIEAWFPGELQTGFADYDPQSAQHDSTSGFNRVELLYNGMIYPLHKYAVKGFLWYQGETNIGRGACYGQKMEAMINHWRDLWGGEKKPFYYVELPPYEYGEDNLRGALLREQQFEVMQRVENTGMACTSDLTHPWETTNIHQSVKTPIARRLLYWALNRDYGFGDAIKPIGPTYKSMEILDGGVVKINFNGSENGFRSHGPIEGFEIAGDNHEFFPAQAVRRHDDPTALYISSYAVGNPKAVRYRFRNCTIGNLWDGRGLPVVPFRTDRWDQIPNNQAH